MDDDDDDDDVQQCIYLGCMSIEGGEWCPSTCYCDICEQNQNPDTEHHEPEDPDEIVINKQDITIIYDYPLEGRFPFKHHTDNVSGFTRETISEQIMNRYRKIYEEESQNQGKYGIYGHSIDQLQLSALYFNEITEQYTLSVDS